MGSDVRKLTSDKDLREVLLEARDLGFEVIRTQGGHIKMTHPKADGPVFASATPSDIKSAANTRAQMQRALLSGLKDRPDLLEYAHEMTCAESPFGNVEYVCPACWGRLGVKKSWTHPEGLAAHMEKEHPALEIAPVDEPPSDQESEQEEEEAPVTASRLKREDNVSAVEIERYLLGAHRDGDRVTLEDFRKEFPGKNVLNAIQVLKRRGVRGVRPNVVWLEQTGSKRSRTYIFHSPFGSNRDSEDTNKGDDDADAAEQREAPAVEVVSHPEAPASSNGHKATHGRLFEEVKEFADGSTLVKDEGGNFFVATFAKI